MLVIIFILVVAPFLYYKYVNRIKGLPPGPTPLPLIGNVITASTEKPDDLMLKLSKEYGDIFTLWLPEPTIVITGHEILQEALNKTGEALAHRPTQFLMTKIYSGQYGLFFNDNLYYKSQRRFAVHTMAHLGVGKSEITNLVNDMALKLCRDLEGTNGNALELRPYLINTVGNVIHKIIFGTLNIDKDEEIEWFQQKNLQVFEDFLEPKMLLLDSFPFIAKFDKLLDYGLERNLKANEEISAFLYKKINYHKTTLNYDEQPTNYVDAFLHEMHRRGEGNLSDEFNEHQLAMSIFDLYSAGMETIVITLRCCILFLLNYPEIKEKLFEEVDQQIGRTQTPVYSEHAKFPYVEAFLQEVYRICYVIELGIFRETNKEIKIGEFTVPAGTRIIPQFAAAHMDEKLFPEPQKCIPERHLKNGVFVRDDRINPFSMGRRNCLGENLARQEVFVFFVSMLQKFDFLPVEDHLIPPVNIITKAFRSPAPFNLRVIPRA